MEGGLVGSGTGWMLLWLRKDIAEVDGGGVVEGRAIEGAKVIVGHERVVPLRTGQG